MQPEIILHIGTHKTGTTSIQRYFGRNRDDLKSLGVWYPRYSELIPGQADHYAHLDFARSIDYNIKNRRFSQQDVALMAAAIVNAHRGYAKTIISAEPFWRVGFASARSSETWDQKDMILRRIRAMFQGANVKVVAILRNQPDFIESLYSEVLLSTGYSGSISKFIEDHGSFFEYKRQLDAWGKYFPVEVISFAGLTGMPDLARGFAAIVTGISEAALPAACDQRWNTTHPVACVAMKRYLNGIKGISPQVRTNMYHRYKRFYLRRFPARISQEPVLRRVFEGKRKRWLSKVQIEAINNRFSEENRKIEEAYGCKVTPAGLERSSSESKLKAWEEQFVLGWMLQNYPPSGEWFDRATPLAD